MRLMQCVQAKDAGCVRAYMDPLDASAYQLDDKRLAYLLDRVNSSLRLRPGDITVAKQPVGTIVVVQVPCLAVATSKELALGFIVSDTAEGIKAPQFVTQLLLTLSVADTPATLNDGAGKLEAWAKYAKEEGPDWAIAGFPGILRDPEEGLITWANWERNCRDRIERVKSL